MVDLLSSLDHFQNGILVPKNKIQSKESETEQKHNAVLQELEDDYEKRLADKARQLEDKVKIWTEKMSEQKSYDIFTGIQPKCKFDILIMIS